MITARAALLALSTSAIGFSVAHPEPVVTIVNLTGLPTYPNLEKPAMAGILLSEDPGRWCARFSAVSTDPLITVENWYRRTMPSASETVLKLDERYHSLIGLSGIKLALGRDYVALYQAGNEPTMIELHRCTWAG